MGFHTRARAEQLIDFKGLQWGKIRPTDIDLSLDWGGQTFVFVELKGLGKGLTLGQKIHLECLVKAIKAGGKEAYAILAQHSTQAKEDIVASESTTIKVYDGNVWCTSHTGKELHEVLNQLHNEHLDRRAQ